MPPCGDGSPCTASIFKQPDAETRHLSTAITPQFILLWRSQYCIDITQSDPERGATRMIDRDAHPPDALSRRRRGRDFARQSDHLARFGRGCRLHVEFAYDPYDTLDQLDIVGEAPARVIEIVLETDPDVATEQQRLHRGVELRRADGADVEDRVLGHEPDHVLQ